MDGKIVNTETGKVKILLGASCESSLIKWLSELKTFWAFVSCFIYGDKRVFRQKGLRVQGAFKIIDLALIN